MMVAASIWSLIVPAIEQSAAKEIFGEYYEDFVKLSSDDTGRNKERAKQISEYVKENGLSFTQYQDYGWDPVVLP